MKHSISHDLGTELATKATKAAFDAYQKKYSEYDPQCSWTSPARAEITFKVKMVKLSGELEIFDDRIDMDLDVPLMFRLFKDRAINAIDREVRVWIAKAESGELD